MAFKALRLSDSTSYVSSMDSAIDWDAIADEELAKNEELRGSDDSLDDKRKRAVGQFALRHAREILAHPARSVALMKFKNGEQPTRFLLGVIPPDDFARIQDECVASKRSEELDWRCFLSGLRDIQGWPEAVPKASKNGVEYVDPEWLRKTFVRGLRKVALDVGSKIWSWNQLLEDEAKN